MSPQLFGTEFAVPTTPTNLVATPDTETSWVALEWDVWPDADELLEEWRVYRTDGAGERTRIDGGLATDPDDPTFTDYGAPWGVVLHYEVVAYDGARESESADIATEIGALGPFLVAPGIAATSWSPLPIPGARRLPRSSKTVHTPLGRETYLTTGSATLRLPAGSASFDIEWADVDQLAKFRALEEFANENEYVYWKPAAGESYRVQILNQIETGPNEDGYGISFDWYTVST